LSNSDRPLDTLAQATLNGQLSDREKMCAMSTRRIAALVTILPVLLPACGGEHRTKPGPFAGHWWGHTRRLEINPEGRGREIVDDGCCNRVVTARFRILRVNGTPSNAVARITFSVVRLDKAVCRENHIRPFKSGQVGTLRLSRGVVTDDLTTVTFCAENVDKCGL
jgi:hypothetical protein